MKWQLFSVFDSATRVYERPFCAFNQAAARRSFVDHVNGDVETHGSVVTHPEDFDLFRVGEFDDESGVTTPFAPQLVITGLEARLVRRQELKS